jgi:hypothetical protein
VDGVAAYLIGSDMGDVAAGVECGAVKRIHGCPPEVLE